MGIQQIPIAASGASLAEITTAIQTNAAPASVTNASIATQVANNATPFGGTYANLGTYSFPTNANTLSITGLSGYKHLKFLCGHIEQNGGNHNYNIRFNNDSSGVYNYRADYLVSTTGDYAKGVNDSSILITYISAGFPASFNMEINNSNSSNTAKYIEWDSHTNFFGSRYKGRGFGIYNSTSAISSAQIFCAANFSTPGFITVLGAN